MKPKNLGIKHQELEEFLEKRTITMIELVKLLEPFIKSFEMVKEITRNLIKAFKEATAELEKVIKGEIKVGKAQELKPFISMTTLSYLYRILTDSVLATNENSTHKLLVSLFFKSWEPYLTILDKWLKHGTLMDRYSEFFIKYKIDLKVIANFYAKIDWNNDYIYQTYTVKWKTLDEVIKNELNRVFE